MHRDRSASLDRWIMRNDTFLRLPHSPCNDPLEPPAQLSHYALFRLPDRVEMSVPFQTCSRSETQLSALLDKYPRGLSVARAQDSLHREPPSATPPSQVRL